jgi:hypothetical protein
LLVRAVVVEKLEDLKLLCGVKIVVEEEEEENRFVRSTLLMTLFVKVFDTAGELFADFCFSS